MKQEQITFLSINTQNFWDALEHLKNQGTLLDDGLIQLPYTAVKKLTKMCSLLDTEQLRLEVNFILMNQMDEDEVQYLIPGAYEALRDLLLNEPHTAPSCTKKEPQPTLSQQLQVIQDALDKEMAMAAPTEDEDLTFASGAASRLQQAIHEASRIK